jgi:hypothetical protein
LLENRMALAHKGLKAEFTPWRFNAIAPTFVRRAKNASGKA